MTIKIKSNLGLNIREKGEEMDIIIPSIESIMNYSKKRNIINILYQLILEKYFNAL